MKKIFYIILFISTAFSVCANKDKADFVYEAPVPLGDPFIMLFENTYYAYGTNANNGIDVYTSEDLEYWEKQPQLALSTENSWGDRWFWAPEIYPIKEKNKFFMYYSADEHICVATSNSLYG